jgi:NAD(P)-dependent dehydrogenase (short-subunit alcohol dehydrogenase family)
MQRLEGKVAVITGGNSGIGLASAKEFVAEGAMVVIVGRDQKKLDAAVNELGPNAIAIRADVSNLDDLDRLYGEVEQKFGKFDILFANAGIAQFRPLEHVTSDFFDSIFNINTKGLYFTVQKAIPLLRQGASVILTTSVGDQTGAPTMSVYVASKAAVRSFARTFSAELVDRGIRVNVLSPGPTDTPIFGRMEIPNETAKVLVETMISQIPMKRLGRPEEIAKVALFLASDDSSFLLGSEIVADGGATQV